MKTTEITLLKKGVNSDIHQLLLTQGEAHLNHSFDNALTKVHYIHTQI